MIRMGTGQIDQTAMRIQAEERLTNTSSAKSDALLSCVCTHIFGISLVSPGCFRRGDEFEFAGVVAGVYINDACRSVTIINRLSIYYA